MAAPPKEAAAAGEGPGEPPGPGQQEEWLRALPPPAIATAGDSG